MLGLLSQAFTLRADTTAGMETVQDACRFSQAVAVECEGRAVGAYAVRPVQLDRGVVLWVMAAGGRLPGINLTAAMMPVIEAQAMQTGARQVAINTRRKGLISQLEKIGYVVTGVTLRKNL